MSLDVDPSSDESMLDSSFDFLDHQCHLCHEHFLTKSEFKLHLQDHGRQDHFTCPQCPQLFRSSTKLWRHLSKVHMFKTKLDFRCSICDNKVFKQAFNFHLHMLIHLEEFPETCRFCKKTFRTKPSLRKHELIHTGQKPFSCQECNSKFKTRDELKQHSISHTTGNQTWKFLTPNILVRLLNKLPQFCFKMHEILICYSEQCVCIIRF